MFEDSALRLFVYDEIVRTSEAPLIARLAREFRCAEADVRAGLRRMHDAHILVLQPSGEVLMANPFSAVPTPFVTRVGERRWFGNCIWDALGILAMLRCDGQVFTSCGCCGDAMALAVRDGALTADATVHFALPARRWWQDIVFN